MNKEKLKEKIINKMINEYEDVKFYLEELNEEFVNQECELSLDDIYDIASQVAHKFDIYKSKDDFFKQIAKYYGFILLGLIESESEMEIANE